MKAAWLWRLLWFMYLLKEDNEVRAVQPVRWCTGQWKYKCGMDKRPIIDFSTQQTVSNYIKGKKILKGNGWEAAWKANSLTYTLQECMCENGGWTCDRQFTSGCKQCRTCCSRCWFAIPKKRGKKPPKSLKLQNGHYSPRLEPLID